MTPARWSADPSRAVQHRPFPVRVNLTGIGRGQTIVDQRAMAHDAGRPDGRPVAADRRHARRDVGQRLGVPEARRLAPQPVTPANRGVVSCAASPRAQCRAWPSSRPACTSTMSRPLTASMTCFSAGPGSAPGLVEDQHALAEGHQGRDAFDAQLTGQLLVGFGVQLGEDDVPDAPPTPSHRLGRIAYTDRTTRPRSPPARCRCR